MAHHDSRYERLDAIERRLAQRPEGWTTGELAKDLGVNQSTVFRDLAMLESRGAGLIKHGWRYTLDHRRSLHTIKMTNDEILVVFLAARLLSRHSDEHNPHVVQALEKLADALREKSSPIAKHIDRAANAVRSRRTRPAYVEALQAVTQGWVTQQKVWIRYRSADGRVSERFLSPYYLEPSSIGYACYVIGIDETVLSSNPTMPGVVKTFKVERIAEATVTKEHYEIPTDFDPQRLLSNAWGVIWRDDDAITVVLHFSPKVAERVKESVWHHSQQIAELPDGGCMYTVHVGSTMEMKPWVRGWGADVTVVAPADLRADIAAEARRTVANYVDDQE